MVEIRPLLSLTEEEYNRIMPGYTSTYRYAVTKSESPERTVIVLELVELAQPYVRIWNDNDRGDIEMYLEFLAAGLSVGAFDGNELVGLSVAQAHEWNRTLWIWEFGVDERYRRQGIGLRMMDALAENARRAGLRVMLVEVQNTNVNAIRFYRAAGFEIEGIDLSYYTNHDVTDGEVALFMKRRLE